jgi:hypothetical protein
VYFPEADTPAIEGAVRSPLSPVRWYYQPMLWLSLLFPDAPPVEVDHFVFGDAAESLTP